MTFVGTLIQQIFDDVADVDAGDDAVIVSIINLKSDIILFNPISINQWKNHGKEMWKINSFHEQSSA
jgi:hypothetical protein